MNPELVVEVKKDAVKEYLFFVKKKGNKGGISRVFIELTQEQHDLVLDSFPGLENFKVQIDSKKFDDTYQGPVVNADCYILFHSEEHGVDLEELVPFLIFNLNKEFRNVFKYQRYLMEHTEYMLARKFYKNDQIKIGG